MMRGIAAIIEKMFSPSPFQLGLGQLLLTPQVHAASLQERLLVKTGTAERVLNADVKQGRGGFLFAVATV